MDEEDEEELVRRRDTLAIYREEQLRGIFGVRQFSVSSFQLCGCCVWLLWGRVSGHLQGETAEGHLWGASEWFC